MLGEAGGDDEGSVYGHVMGREREETGSAEGIEAYSWICGVWAWTESFLVRL